MPNRAEPGRPAAGHKPNGGCRTGLVMAAWRHTAVVRVCGMSPGSALVCVMYTPPRL